jgi:hypothetical protein
MWSRLSSLLICTGGFATKSTKKKIVYSVVCFPVNPPLRGGFAEDCAGAKASTSCRLYQECRLPESQKVTQASRLPPESAKGTLAQYRFRGVALSLAARMTAIRLPVPPASCGLSHRRFSNAWKLAYPFG